MIFYLEPLCLSKFQNKNSGSIFIAVLIILLGLSALATSFFKDFHERVILLDSYSNKHKVDLYFESLLEVSLDIIRNNRSISNFDEVIANKENKKLGFIINIYPEKSRMNLNWILSDNKRFRNASLEFLNNCDIEQKKDCLFYYVNRKFDNETLIKESCGYDKEDAVISPDNYFVSPKEIGFIPAFKNKDLFCLSQTFSAFGRDKKINLSYADKQTILTLFPELGAYWEQIEDFRRSKKIETPNDLLRIGIPEDLYLEILPYLNFDENIYEVVIKVERFGVVEFRRYVLEFEKYSEYIKIVDSFFSRTYLKHLNKNSR
ncbi:MAG: hypothetical protein ACOC1P_00485 [Minisyncoccales bacterium]